MTDMFALPAVSGAPKAPSAAAGAKEKFNDPVPAAPGADSAPAPKLIVELDAASGRLVRTLLDPVSESVLWRYPNESQLAFSRGVAAYMRAMQSSGM
ncbi:MAG: hypothetical protein AB7L65_01500 [Hyphomonadaceae bacterium]